MRLYDEGEFEKFEERAPPEISSADLTPVALLLCDWGCGDVMEIVEGMPFVDPPPEDGLRTAFEILSDLGAVRKIKESGFVMTNLGRAVARMPTHPRLAVCIASAKKESLAVAVTAAALLDDETGDRRKGGPDLSQRVRDVLRAGPDDVRGRSVVTYASRMGNGAKSAVLTAMSVPEHQSETLGEALLPGFVDLVAHRRGNASYESSTYMLSLGRAARLDGIRDAAEYVVVADTTTGDDGKARIRAFAPISDEVLDRVAVECDTCYTGKFMSSFANTFAYLLRVRACIQSTISNRPPMPSTQPWLRSPLPPRAHKPTQPKPK